jgi:hypothetical protein
VVIDGVSCASNGQAGAAGHITCTGPSNDKNAEWPAITTNGKPIAGPGVSQALLGRVFRKGAGRQRQRGQGLRRYLQPGRQPVANPGRPDGFRGGQAHPAFPFTTFFT